MKTLKLKTLLVSLCLLSVSLPAFASENGGRGGGDEVSCAGGILGWIFQARELTDFRSVESRNLLSFAIFDKNDGIDESSIRDAILKFLDQTQPQLGAQLRTAFSKIKFTEVADVENVDTGIKVGLAGTIILGCSKKMLAAQDFNTPSEGLSSVRIVQSRYKSLSLLEQALLKTHEAFIYLAHTHLTDIKAMETEARGQVATLFNSDGFDAFIIPEVFKSATHQPVDVTARLEDALEDILDHDDNSFNLHDDVAQWNVRELVGAGLDPNLMMECKLPLLDYAMTHRVVTGGDSTNSSPRLTGSGPAIALMENGADVNSKIPGGETPLFIAVQANIELVRSLLDHGADINATWCPLRIKDGTLAITPLDLAYLGSYELESLLKSHGAKSGVELGQRCFGYEKPSKEQKQEEQCLESSSERFFPRFY